MQLFDDEEAANGSVGLTVNKKYASRFEVGGEVLPRPHRTGVSARPPRQCYLFPPRTTLPLLDRQQHNKKREELHRLKEKYPVQAARLERQVGLMGTYAMLQAGVPAVQHEVIRYLPGAWPAHRET